ncbi:hypothetical protein CTAYLR_003123 [Chrysophaeum taylorii]|uniref:Large ribosomal subunit protein eL14 domain-containing protein n=1 Tax=Chrysophaeum taylorii TaxID=2483200 RepID=A0AAD7XRR6_9STRA|nr:hypothetical protein CTAYLR_003123 [Chrysophaeum taylorii]
MGFTRFVEVGRVCLVNYGPDNGKLGTIIDIVDGNKCLVDGPRTHRPRATSDALQATRPNRHHGQDPEEREAENAQSGVGEGGCSRAMGSHGLGQKLAAKKKRANLTDFQRFQLMVARKQRAALVKEKLDAIKDGTLVPSVPEKKAKTAPPPAEEPEPEPEPAAAADY